MQIRWTKKARENLLSLENFIRKDKPRAAIETVIKIIKTIEILTEHPHMGRIGRLQNTRELVIVGTPFIIVYQVNDIFIEIIRVLHAAKRWPESLKE